MNQQPTATDMRPAQRLRRKFSVPASVVTDQVLTILVDPPAPSGRLRPASWESSSCERPACCNLSNEGSHASKAQCSTQSAIRLPQLGLIEVFSEDEIDLDGPTSISIRGSGAGQSDGAKVTAVR